MSIPTKVRRFIIPISMALGVVFSLQIQAVPSFLARIVIGVFIGLSLGIVAIVESSDPTTKFVLSLLGAIVLFLAFLVLTLGSVLGNVEMVAIGLGASIFYFFGVRRL